MVENLTKEEASRYVRGGSSMWDAIYANGYSIPNKSSPMCTNAFMVEIYNGTVLVPKANEIKVHNIPYPPTREQITVMVAEIIEKNEYENEDL